MSLTDTTLYVRVHDLVVWILQRVRSWDAGARATVGEPIARAATHLLETTSLALTFPAGRVGQLLAADHNIVRLRVLLRAAVAMELLADRQLRFAAGELREIGCMLGHWQKRLEAGKPYPEPS